MKTSIINGSEVSRLSVAIQSLIPGIFPCLDWKRSVTVGLLRRKHKILMVLLQKNLPGCRAVHVPEFINGEPHSCVVVHVIGA